jgi:N-acetylmuramoyl-L-alanine amidase
MRKRFIVIHHSLTDDGNTLDWGAIRRYHIGTNGWDDIGYHYGVEKVDGGYEIVLGRLSDMSGAHCKELGMNMFAFGVCLVGNFDEVPAPLPQLVKAERLCQYLINEYNIPIQNILGHREVGAMAGFDWKKHQYKSCPGSQFDMDEFRKRLHA